VVRDNETWEKISQKLSRPLQKGKCYEFKIFLARSAQYIGESAAKGGQANYSTPVKLRIYGGFSPCDKQFVLAETNLIINYRWLEYNLRLEPLDDYTHFTFEAFYKTPNPFPYNGNILLDNASPISPITEDCAEKPELAKTTPPKKDSLAAVRPTDPFATSPAPVETPKVAPVVLVNPNLSTLKTEDLSKGQTLRMSSINFAVNDTLINRASYPQLDGLLQFMQNNPSVVIEIGGHTNGLCDDDYCNRLSLRRARAVASYLIAKGIPTERLLVKGYGKTQPVSAVKSDVRNQRVEVKILEINK
jgi:outer membrane protein OmpA-like peptidoglycan-associated protein